MKKRLIGTYLDEEQIKKLKEKANYECVSVAFFIREVLYKNKCI
jgi:predicted DNA binding CopG/RHH family protein